ncbi:ataxin-3 [Gorgonomyces haynaldii]|nr:ataxin-3 [Gorgonomyces haynaldii]
MDIPQLHFEKQEGLLCAQHALNNLLQGPYFSAVDLATLAQQLDQEEQDQLEPGARLSESANYNDTGYFSLQVIQRALQVWDLELIPLASKHPIVDKLKQHPELADGYICHFEQHWLTLRKFGHSTKRWLNLNSMLKEPEHLTETYLQLYLNQLQTEGYHVFVIAGTYPSSPADDYCMQHPEAPKQVSGQRLGTRDEELERAIAMSLGEDDADMALALQQSLKEHEQSDIGLRKALEASLKDSTTVQGIPVRQLSEQEMMRRKRLERFEQK